jgi:hypothetical protein
MTVPGEAEAICLRHKGEGGNSGSMLPASAAVAACKPVRALQGRRRDMASHGKETQRRAAGKASGIDGTVRLKAL